MALRKRKPTSAGRRFQTVSDFSDITKTTPERTLLAPKPGTGGRNNLGRKTARHKGGGHKQRYRIIDFRRVKDGVPAKVAAIEYDPNRNCRIALLHYHDGEKAYIIAPNTVQVGDVVQSGQGAEIRPGNALPLRYIPVGTTVHNVELQARAAAARSPAAPARACSSWPRRATSPPCACRAPRCAACRSTAAPPSARSATPRPNWSRSARPAETAGRACARRPAASP